MKQNPSQKQTKKKKRNKTQGKKKKPKQKANKKTSFDQRTEHEIVSFADPTA